MTEVVVYSKPGCCLCDEVKDLLEMLQASHAFNLRVVNILEDSDAYQKFKEEIPVVFIDGKEAFKGYLEETQFRKRLESDPAKLAASPAEPGGLPTN